VPHAHHFLERLDRVTRAQMDFALGLYRDHEAVRYVLEHVKLPEAERIALAIDDPEEGPFVLVTREGRFVTCLGKGMHHDHPVIPRGQVDALLAKVADKRARKELAHRELMPGEDEDDIFQRVLRRGSRLAREDFLAISAFAPALGADTWRFMLDLSAETIKVRVGLMPGAMKITVIREKLARALEALYRFEWSVAHLMVLSCAGERKELDDVIEASDPIAETPSFPCSVHSGLPFFMRAAWAAARLGRGALPRYKRVFAENDNWLHSFDAALGLGAIAFRHSGSAAEIRRMMLGYEMPAPERVDMAAMRGRLANAVVKVLAESEQQERDALLLGARVCVQAGEHLPEGHALHFAEPEAVPRDLARTMALSIDVDTWDVKTRGVVFTVLPLAARASAEDFFFPREGSRAWFGPWEPEESLERLTRIARGAAAQQPARAKNAVGRNDPCPCGSGKKWKKCCGR
jgi:hypothetical protein